MSRKQLWPKQTDFILAFNWNDLQKREMVLEWNGAKVILLFYLILSPNL